MTYNVITQEAEQHKEIVFSTNVIGLPQKIVLDKDEQTVLLEDSHGELSMLLAGRDELDYIIVALTLAKEWGWLSEQGESA